MAWLGVLVPAAALLAGAAALRGAEHDEAYTVFLAMGTPRPDWPDAPFTVTEAWGRLAGESGFGQIAADLRRTDVHPPLYFWAVAGWRALVGGSLLATRLFSVLCAVAALALVGAIARRLRLPAVPAMALALGCYGFAYTGAVARGFALAQLLNLAGVWLLLRAGGMRGALLGGLALGAATGANYLAGFVGGEALLWLLLARGPAMGLAALAGFAPWLPVDLWFFLAQRGSRVGQFPPFAWAPALARLGQYGAANLVGGLPLYAGAARGAVTAGLGAGLLGLGGLVLWRWRGIGGRWLLGLCALAPALGLLGLGVVFDNTPIELRYLAFATPFVALLLAGALAEQRIVLGLLLGVQATGIAGLLTRPETMQPQAAAAREAAALAGTDGLVLLARGNDGVGLVGSVLLAAPAEMRLHLVTPETTPEGLREVARAYPRLALVLLAPDAAGAAEAQLMQTAFADDPCWRVLPAPANLRALQRMCGG